MAEPASVRQVSVPEFISTALIVVAFIVIQMLIGGTRLLFSFPAYAILALAALVSLFALRRTKPAPSAVCFWASVLFFGYILVRAFLSPVPYLARADIYSVVAGLVLYFTVACVLTSASARMAIAVALLVFSTAHVVIAVIQFRFGNNFMPFSFLQRFDYGHRGSGFYICPNHLAGLLEVIGIIGLSILCWSRWPAWARLIVAYATGVCYIGVLLTGSRGGFLSVAASLVIFLFLGAVLLRRAGDKVLLRTGTIAAIVLAFAGAGVSFMFHASEHLRERTNILDERNMRLELWKGALQQWKLQPLLGTGSGTYLYYGRMFRTPAVQVDPTDVHNDYLHLLAEYGVTGAAFFLLFLAAHLRNGWRNFQRLGPRRVALSFRLPSNTMALQIGALAAVAAYMIHSIVDFNLHIPANVLLLAFVFGVLANAGAPRSGESATGFQPWRLVAPALALVLLVQSVRYLPGEYFTERARQFWADDQPALAIPWAQRALEHETQNPDLYDYLGRSRSDLAETITDGAKREALYQAAIADFKKGRALAPLDETFPLELGFVYDALQRYPEAEWMFYEARGLDPKSESTRGYYEAHLLRWKGKGAGASAGDATKPQ